MTSTYRDEKPAPTAPASETAGGRAGASEMAPPTRSMSWEEKTRSAIVPSLSVIPETVLRPRGWHICVSLPPGVESLDGHEDKMAMATKVETLSRWVSGAAMSGDGSSNIHVHGMAPPVIQDWGLPVVDATTMVATTVLSGPQREAVAAIVSSRHRYFDDSVNLRRLCKLMRPNGWHLKLPVEDSGVFAHRKGYSFLRESFWAFAYILREAAKADQDGTPWTGHPPTVFPDSSLEYIPTVDRDTVASVMGRVFFNQVDDVHQLPPMPLRQPSIHVCHRPYIGPRLEVKPFSPDSNNDWGCPDSDDDIYGDDSE